MCKDKKLHSACPSISMKIMDVKIVQPFFVQKTSTYLVILGEPYITMACMETNMLDNELPYARVKSQDGKSSIQFFMVRSNNECNWDSLKDEVRTFLCRCLKCGTKSQSLIILKIVKNNFGFQRTSFVNSLV